MKSTITTVLLASAMAALVPSASGFAQEQGQVQSELNRIEALEVAEQGGSLFVRLQFAQPLTAPPASFSVANPARIAFDFPATANALGRGVQEIGQGDLRSANIVQAGDRTRLVLNLLKMTPYETRVDGRNVVIALSPVRTQAAPTSGAQAYANFAAPNPDPGAGASIRDINFRRGKEGEGRVVVQLSNAETGIDIRQQGGNLVVDFLKMSLPEHLRRRSDVTDFATPVTSMTAQQQGDNVRLVVAPNGLWEHNAYQSDDQFVLEVKRVVEDPNKLVQGARGQYQGEKLSLNFQNIDVRLVLQVIADFTNFNIITSDSVQGNLTLRLKDVPWDQALDIVLRAKDLDMRKSGNVIWVAPRAELAMREKAQSEAAADLESLEQLSTEIVQIRYHKAAEIADFLASKGQADRGFLSKRGKVSVDERSNKIFVTDVSSRLAGVRQIVAQIDEAPRQVLIEARVVEANKDFARDVGVRLSFGDTVKKNLGDGAQIGFGSSALGGSGAAANSFVPGTSSSGGASPITDFANLNLSLFNRGATRFLNLELSALESDGRGRVISSPRVLTANLMTATIEQGTEIPYTLISDTRSDVQFKKAVLSLSVTPNITPDGRIRLEVQVNKDRADFSRSVQGVPPIDTKNVKTEVMVENGGTVILGGVYEEDEASNVNRVPLLGEIPVVGALFRTKTQNVSKRELLIFITPDRKSVV